MPQCKPWHESVNGPYCVNCSGEEAEAFELVAKLRVALDAGNPLAAYAAMRALLESSLVAKDFDELL